MEEQDWDVMESKGMISKMRSLLFGSLFKWLYIAIGIPGCIIAYNFYRVLDKKGFFESFAHTVSGVINSIEHLSTKCPSLIHDFQQFTHCLGF